MKQVSIEVIIEADGETKIEPKGFSGKACLKETKNLEEALGRLQDRKETADMHKTEVIGNKVKVGQ